MTRAEWLAREQEAAENRAQAIQAYRDSLTADCVHGRRRAVHGHGKDMQAGYACKAGKCGMIFLSPVRIYREWRDADPGVNQ